MLESLYLQPFSGRQLAKPLHAVNSNDNIKSETDDRLRIRVDGQTTDYAVWHTGFGEHVQQHLRDVVLSV